MMTVKKFRYYWQGKAFRLFGDIMKAIPLRIGYAVADALGLLIYYLVKRRRDIAINNLAIAFPDVSKAERVNLTKIVFVQLVYSLVEMFWAERLYRAGRVHLHNEELLKTLAERNTGAILVTLHMGNWDMYSALPTWGYNTYAVARAQSNVEFDKVLNEQRTRFGTKIIVKGAGSKQFLTCLRREKGLLVLICDQYTWEVPIKFFGQSTRAPEGPARLAMTFKAPLILSYILRDNANHHHIYIDKEIAVVRGATDEETIALTTQSIYNSFEELIARHPDQYYWVHDRFKK